MGDGELLQMRGISKTFPGVVALDSVDFTLRAGEVHALMGENGAGKSTLIKVLTGAYRRDVGEIMLGGQDIHPRSPAHAQQLGISTVYQEINLIPQLSVAENIFLGRQPRRWGCINWRMIHRRCREALARLDLDIDVRAPLFTCSIAVRQLIAIARALDISARVLVLDEPTSSLDAGEVDRLFALMRRLREGGLGIIFITHFLAQVYDIADRVTILRNGKLVGEYATAELPRHQLVAKMMGKELADFETQPHPSSSAQAMQPLVEARHVARRGSLQNVDLTIRSGEIVALAGLLGSGRSETASMLFGLSRPTSGKLLIDGKPASLPSPRAAIRRGFAMVPEDRKTQSIIPDLSVRENIVLVLQARSGWLRFLGRRKQMQLADHHIRALGIATPDADTPIRNLSGGNQQKAIVARWLASSPRLLILDEPTRGIDVGAKAEILRLILSLCQKGMAILFISSELEEMVRCASRVVVLRDRATVAELSGAAISEQSIIAAIAAKVDDS